jgi:hypothetical protein
MNLMWFVCSNDVVSGPFKTEEVQTKLSTGQLPAGAFIWWKGQHEWMPIGTWQTQLTQIVSATQVNPQNQIWYLDLGTGSPIGPLTQKELLDHLNRLESLNRVNLWTAGMANWQKIFEFHDIMDRLGISRRESPRAPLMGTVALTRSNDEPGSFVLKAASISVGGIGLTGSHDLQKEDQLSLLVKSSEFQGGLHVRGTVAYVTSNGYVGIRFHKVSAETHAMIFDYVKRFNGDQRVNAEAA